MMALLSQPAVLDFDYGSKVCEMFAVPKQMNVAFLFSWMFLSCRASAADVNDLLRNKLSSSETTGFLLEAN
jgi:hypothetical protein